MKVYLCARDQDLFDAWTRYCGHYDFVTVTKQDIMSIDAEALVSPANSFGFMTGGIDLHYKNYIGQEMEDELRRTILERYNNELLVGQAAEVRIKPPPLVHYKYLVAAPTMRVPENISHTINAYLAARAALILAYRAVYKSIVFPGLGTGTGGMSPEDCAKQVSEAIKYALVDKKWFVFPVGLYEEQDHMRKHLVPSKWFDVQRM